jgi:hypothetical protein
MSRTGSVAERQADAAREGVETLGRMDPYWPAQVTVLAAILLSFNLPPSLTIQQVWLIPAIESVLLFGLVVSTPWVPSHRHPRRRFLSLGLVATASASNLVNLALLVHVLLSGKPTTGTELVVAGAEIWITNVLLFTVWYWQLDRGGPIARRSDPLLPPDFLFPQMARDDLGGINWRARYIDYIYTSFTNATAFSPTDTMPLTPTAKMLFLVQSTASLVTIGLVFARAVNILQ